MNINIQQALILSFLKKPSLKTKKIIDISYLKTSANKNDTINNLGF